MSLLDRFEEREKGIPFLIFISFFVSFSFARIYEYLAVVGPSLEFFGGKYTGHHFYYGIAFLITAGWLAINYRGDDNRLNYVSAILYGIGLGLFFDEIGLILTHFENYWDWITYTFIVAISVTLLNIVFFREFWDSVGSDILSFAKENNLDRGPLNLMGLISLLGMVDRKMPRTSQITTAFIGSILILAGILVMEYPEFIKYWIAGAFVLSGFSYIVQAVKE